MPTLAEILLGKIRLDIESVDHVYLNGYVPNLQMGGGVVNFIREQFEWPIPSPKALYEMTERFKRAFTLKRADCAPLAYPYRSIDRVGCALHCLLDQTL
jgi:hypothetical protein